MNRRSLCALLVLGVAALAAPRLSAGELPKAEKLMDKYVEVTGGKEAYLKLKNRVVKGTVAVGGINGDFEGDARHSEASLDGGDQRVGPLARDR